MNPKSAVWHPFTQHAVQPEATLISGAEGAWLHAADGRRIFDAVSSWWVVTHGHRHPHIMQAIKNQIDRLDQVIFAGFTHEPAETLARQLIAVTPPELEYVFFSDSGSTSVEVALKMALGFWRHRGESRNRILALEGAYHGDTIGGMSVGERGVFNAPDDSLLFDVERLPFPRAGSEQATLDALETACRSGTIAALIVEPLILGAGGMLIYPPWVLAEMKRICQTHDVLLIADEAGEDMPRNIEFLYSQNRLNVAISRARCLSVVFASPRLLEIPCNTIEQMQLVNTLCWAKHYSDQQIAAAAQR